MSSPSPLSARVLHPHRPHEQLLAAVVGVLCRRCWHWWCRPSHSPRRCPRRAVLVLLLALAIALLARRCPALESLALVAVTTRNPPYEQGLVGLGRVRPLSFLSPSPPHCRFSPSFPIPIPVVPRFRPVSSRGGSGCGGVAVVGWGSTPHIPAVTTKENISYLTKKKKIPSATQTTAAVIRTRSWMGVGCVVLATVANNSSYPNAQRRALS